MISRCTYRTKPVRLSGLSVITSSTTSRSVVTCFITFRCSHRRACRQVSMSFSGLCASASAKLALGLHRPCTAVFLLHFIPRLRSVVVVYRSRQRF